MKHLTVLGFLVAVTGWCVMIGVGVLHSAGAVGWTISYDDAVALTAVTLPPVLLVLGAFTSVMVDARKGPGRPDPF